MKRYQSLLLLVCALALTCGCKKSDPNASVQDSPQVADQNNYDLAEPIQITELQTEQEYRDFLANNEIAVVKFGAEWCPPCRELDSELQKIAGYFQTEGVAFATVDVDDFKSLAASLGVSGIPDTQLYYHSAFYSNVLGNAPREIASLVASVCQKTTTLKDGNVTNKPSDAEIFAAYEDDDNIVFDNNSYPEFTDPVNELFADVDPGEVTSLPSVQALENFVKENAVAVVKFGAVWCPPCRKLDERLPLLAGKYPNIAVGTVDVDKVPALANRFGAKTIPATIVFVNGALKSSCVGYLPEKIVENVEAGLALAQKSANPTVEAAPAIDEPAPETEATPDAFAAPEPAATSEPALDAYAAETSLSEENE